MPYQIKNGIIYSGNAVTLTQAQYDALTTAEKNNGTVYYIYDSDTVMDAGDVGIEGGGTLQDLVGSVATIEASPATAAHAVGSYILWNGQLYEVTSAIAVGETLTVGSNITATTLTNGLMKYPDYSSSGILYNFSTSAVTLNYTAPEDCYMNIHVINTSAASLSVNGVAIASSARAGDYYQLSYAGYLEAGDVVTSSGVVRGIILKLR